MDFTSVRIVEDEEQKSQQEIERELLAQKEREDAERQKAEEQTKVKVEDTIINEDSFSIKDEDLFKYLSEKTGRQITGYENLIEEKQAEIPSDVEAFLRYKKETGRGIDDYMKLQRDVNSIKEDELLADYFLATETGIDESDLPVLMAEFQYDEDIDDEAHIRKAKLAKKQMVGKARKYFEEQKSQYKMPIEQIDNTVMRKDSDEYKAYQQWLEQTEQKQSIAEQRRGFFMKKTEELFSPEFKGFEFQVDDKKLMYTPGDPKELQKMQADPMNFIGKYVGQDGNISDIAGYHKALAVAMNPEKFAKHFYDQGVAKATEELMAKMKNVDMQERQTPQYQKPDGLQIKEVSDQSYAGGLKIKQR